MENRDEMLQIDLCSGQVRVMLCETTATVQKCTDIHESTPVCTAALGRLMTGTLMLGIMMVAAPGVPGGAIMAALGVLSSMLGFGEQEQALMIALYIAMDNFGTACNVTGDGAIALVVDRFFRKGKAAA